MFDSLFVLSCLTIFINFFGIDYNFDIFGNRITSISPSLRGAILGGKNRVCVRTLNFCVDFIGPEVLKLKFIFKLVNFKKEYPTF